MAIKDRIRGLTKKAQDTAAEHKDEIQQAVEKAEVTADQRTGGKYHDQIASAAAKAEAYVEKLDPEETPGDGRPDPSPPPERPAS